MKSIYKIKWSENALEELNNTIKYLEQNFSIKELNKLAIEIEKIVLLISKNPKIFKKVSQIKNIRRVVILKYNTILYKVNSDTIEILSFFSNRQDILKILF